MNKATKKAKLAVLISGTGRNLQAIINESLQPYFPAVVDCVISNNDQAYGLTIAGDITKFIVQRKDLGSFDACDDRIQEILMERKIDYVCLAGFMRILGAKLVNQWPNKMLNIHPALLPSFKGMNGPAQAIDSGVKIAGCTVHFVVPEIDAGAIIAQAAVKVIPNDDAASLSDRIMKAELICYSYAIMKMLGVSNDILMQKISLAMQQEILLA